MNIKYIDNKTVINLDTNKRFVLDDIGKKFIDIFLDEDNTEMLIERMAKEYNIDVAIIKKDFNEFISKIEIQRDFSIGELPYSDYMVLEPTNECSGNCLHCFQRYEKKYSWDKGQIDSYIDYLKKNNIRYISLTGGEVLSPHYIENTKYIVKTLKKNNIQIVTISTNGMFITEDIMNWLDQQLDLSKITFRISLDSINEEKIKMLRPGYKNKYNNILWDIIEKFNCNVVVTTIIYQQSAKEIVDIEGFLKSKKNVKKWILKPLIPTKESHNYLKSNFKNLSEIYIEVLNYFKNNKEDIRYDFSIGNVISKNMLLYPEMIQKYYGFMHPCKDEKNQKTLKSSGEITRCPILSEIDSKYMIDLSDFNDINNNLFYDLELSQMNCSKCKYMKLCGGGCRAYAIAYKQGIYGCDINSKQMWKWIFSDGYIKNEWTKFFYTLKKILE